jgi:glycosyltransferase involved in cell wall biosynthesis
VSLHRTVVKVSVIVVTYNHARFIAQALDSVLAQETDFPYEVIISEDCSTDGTRDIVLEYQRNDFKRIRLLLSAENLNTNDVLTRAIQAAHGRYIALLDGDDYWTSPYKLQKQVQFLDAHPDYSICFHNALIHFADGDAVDTYYNDVRQKLRPTVVDLWTRNFMATSSVMLRRDAVRELPIWYAAEAFGDWPLYMLVAEKGDIRYIPETMSVYRRHRDGVFGGMSSAEQLRAILTFYDSMLTKFGAVYAPVIRKAMFRHECLLVNALVESGDIAGARSTLLRLSRSKCALVPGGVWTLILLTAQLLRLECRTRGWLV